MLQWSKFYVFFLMVKKKPDSKLQPLAGAYTQLVEAPKGDVKPDPDLLGGYDNTRCLRSGSTHPRVSTNPSPNPSSPPFSNKQESTAKMATSTIKLLPTSASVRAFSGTDADYSARDFIRQCNDVITNSFVTANGDKIAFVRSRLQPGSRACCLMQASAFTEPQESKNYPEFRSNFLETFGEAEKRSLLKALNAGAKTVWTVSDGKDMFITQISANRVATDWLKCLKDTGWFERENNDLYSNYEIY